MNKLEDKITKLTALWCELVCLDHHKDRDCHWYINKTWSYGDTPLYFPEHLGYIFDVDPDELTAYRSYEEAEKALFELIKRAFKEEFNWAFNKDVEPEDWNMDRAVGVRNLYSKYKEIINND